MSFKFFHERLPWQPKLPCNFHKNLYVIRTLFLIFLWKISFLAQRVHVPEILRHFSQFYPTHSRLVYDPTGTILAIYIGRCPICFLQNISLIRLVVLEKKIFEGFLPYLALAAILNFGSKPFNYFSLLQCLDATYEIWSHLAQWFQRRSRLKVWTDDGRRLPIL